MSLASTDYNPWDGECKNLNGKGAYVLQGWILAESPWDESYNLGIYNCRPPSVHGHERAGDAGFPVINGKPHRHGFELSEWLWKERDHFGIQLVIWNRKIISRTKPWWREYNGPSPHIDHVHWELNWWGYFNLTRAIILDHQPIDWPPIPTPPTTPLPPYSRDEEKELPVVIGHTGNRQNFLVDEESVTWLAGGPPQVEGAKARYGYITLSHSEFQHFIGPVNAKRKALGLPEEVVPAT